MKERPILFSGPMVKAILEGRKTQTRRVLKFSGEDEHRAVNPALDVVRCPYGQPGDRLWVRETFVFECDVNGNQPPFDDGRPIQRDETIDSVSSWTQPHYRATDPAPDLVCQNPAHDGGSCCHWRPSIYMPRWASRITLEITKIRVERVQEITGANAVAEGIEVLDKRCGNVTRIGHFRQLWDSINAKRGFGWAKNPWVWVVEFKRAN